MTTVTIPLTATPTPPHRIGITFALAARRLALTVRSPRSVAVPLLAPVMFALVVAPALANNVAAPHQRATFMTYFALATAGLLIPLNCMFSGLGVIVDRQQGAMRELLVAPIRRTPILAGNLMAATAITASQLAVLLLVSAARGADYEATSRAAWFVLAALALVVLMYSVAEIISVRLDNPVEYTGALPAVAIVPFFFAGTLYPLTSLPHWLTYVARALPLTHAVALFRYGLTGGGSVALHNIWGLSDTATEAALSLGVLVAFAAVALAGAARLSARATTS